MGSGFLGGLGIGCLGGLGRGGLGGPCITTWVPTANEGVAPYPAVTKNSRSSTIPASSLRVIPCSSLGAELLAVPGALGCEPAEAAHEARQALAKPELRNLAGRRSQQRAPEGAVLLSNYFVCFMIASPRMEWRQLPPVAKRLTSWKVELPVVPS